MPEIIKKCPICNGELYISELQCKDCNLKLSGDFKVSFFDSLSKEQQDFLIAFVKHKGNLRSLVQDEDFDITYAGARKQLSNLAKLLPDKKRDINVETDIQVDENDVSASNIIKAKLKQSDGKARVESLTGKEYEIYAKADNTFYCNELESSPKYTYEVFDKIVGYRLEKDNTIVVDKEVPKGDGRGKKLGEPGCDENTVVGRIAMHIGKKEGESVDDPVAVLVAILDWAGVAENKRGYIQLTKEYLEEIERKNKKTVNNE